MNKLLLILGLCFFSTLASAQISSNVGPGPTPPPCRSFGTSTGTCIQGGTTFTNTAQPVFSVYLASDQTISSTGNNTINFDTVIKNQGSFYNTTTHQGTAPVTGTYLCNVILYVGSGQTTGQFAVSFITTNRSYGLWNETITALNTTGQFIASGSAIVDMTAGNTVLVQSFSGTSTSYVISGGSTGRSFFSCGLLY